METRFLCHVQANDGKQPESFDSNNALAIMYRIADVIDRAKITFQVAPNQHVAIKCDFNIGEVTTQEINNSSGVKHFYSFQTEPLKNAMSVIAKLKLFEWLVTLGDTNINHAIQKNLTHLSESSVMQTHRALLQSPSWLRFGAITNESKTRVIVRQVLQEQDKQQKDIGCLNDVIHIKNQITARLVSPAPVANVKPSAGSSRG